MGRDHVVASKTRKLSSPLVWPHIYLPKKPRGVAANFLFPFARQSCEEMEMLALAGCRVPTSKNLTLFSVNASAFESASLQI
jgi:hypothetical protein